MKVNQKNTSLLVAALMTWLVSACADVMMGGGEGANKGHIQESENETADEPVAVSGAFLTECGVALSSDVPQESASGKVWIGCGVVSSADRSRPVIRPRILEVEATYLSGKRESLTLRAANANSPWDILALASSGEEGGITKLALAVEGLPKMLGHIVGSNDKRYSAKLGNHVDGQVVSSSNGGAANSGVTPEQIAAATNQIIAFAGGVAQGYMDEEKKKEKESKAEEVPDEDSRELRKGSKKVSSEQ